LLPIAEWRERWQKIQQRISRALGDKCGNGTLVLPEGRIVTKSIKVIQGNQFTESLDGSDASGTTVAVSGAKGLRATRQGNRVTISGRIATPGKHEITIVEKKITKIIIEVARAKSVLKTPVTSLLMGKRVPLDPPAKP
jgi:hypothetical protein